MQKLIKGKVRQAWQQAPLKRKIKYFLISVGLVILASVIFDIWIAKYSLFDFYKILDENNKVNELILATENERSQFESYVREDYHNPEDTELFYRAVERSRKAINSLTYDFNRIGANRYGLTWSIKNAYEVYETARNDVLDMSDDNPDYVECLYEVYEMQDYIVSYSRELMNFALEDGDQAYSNSLPRLLVVPVIIVTAAIALTFVSVSLVALVNKSLIHEEELSRLEMERQVQSMKFEVLKNQINPHFLFNTLNVISGMAKLEGAATTDKMINALSSLFRYNLKTQSPMVSLAQEIKVVNDYMYLQQMRFGDRITYEINCKEEAYHEMIPPFTLQPLVENSIIHGLSVKEEGGHISIDADKNDDFLIIRVKDTGVGMDVDKLKDFMKEWDMPTGKYKGIGLGNIKKRIENFYEEGNVKVDSIKDVGTTITIEIPLTKEKE